MKRSYTLAAAVAVLALGMVVPVRAQKGTAADFRSAEASWDPSNFALNPVVYVEVTHTQNFDNAALWAVSRPQPGSGRGVWGVGGKIGVEGYAYSTSPGSGKRYGVLGVAGNGTINYGLFGESLGSGANYAVYASGDLAYTGNLIGPPSDLKLKENLAALDSGLAKLMDLKVVTYEHKHDPELSHMNLPEGPQVGFIAQQVAEVLPELVTEAVHPAKNDLDGTRGMPGAESDEPIRYLAIKPLQMIPILVRAIQEQQVEIEALKAQLGPLQRRLAELDGTTAGQVELAGAP